MPHEVTMNKAAKKLARLFKRKKVMDMETIRDATGGRSRRSIFRDLAVLQYLSSYTHVGRYYMCRSSTSIRVTSHIQVVWPTPVFNRLKNKQTVTQVKDFLI